MEKIMGILRERKLTKLQLAMVAGINPSDLYSALNGKKPFYPAWRQRISEYLDVPESDLFEEVKDDNTK